MGRGHRDLRVERRVETRPECNRGRGEKEAAIEIDRRGPEGLICRDNIRADIKVVFSDLVMPRMNGFELLRNIRESIHTRISQLPVVIITGHNDDERMHRQPMSLGATDFITKPFDSIQLKARAKACVKYEDTSRKLEHASWIIETQSSTTSRFRRSSARSSKSYFWYLSS